MFINKTTKGKESPTSLFALQMISDSRSLQMDVCVGKKWSSKPNYLKTISCFEYIIIICQIEKKKQFDEKFLDIDIQTYVNKLFFNL